MRYSFPQESHRTRAKPPSGRPHPIGLMDFPGGKDTLKNIRDSLNGACERAGVSHIRVHGLRHTLGRRWPWRALIPLPS